MIPTRANAPSGNPNLPFRNKGTGFQDDGAYCRDTANNAKDSPSVYFITLRQMFDLHAGSEDRELFFLSATRGPASISSVFAPEPERPARGRWPWYIAARQCAGCDPD